ncbi:hypothetical protein AAFF_G00436340 [Aldrovandia affinis]|uniref:Fork-head domain-containing protein n=1 Tax=Aldrovandia affinis TaxID=143900 RepID=A0AAD7WI90_9TELE|nr:hypothetical protein AAFF_G00436340 [Aldrovandia affinis]
MSKFYDPIASVAQEISDETCLLCFDEFQVTDVADAMILKMLFENLFLNSVVVVATSNRPPEDLYKNGLQRATFLPFIAVLKEYCQTVCLDSGIDYRQRDMPPARKLYYLTSEADVEADMDKLFDELAQQQNDITRPRILKVQGRKLRLSKTCGTLADLTFKELCDCPLGAGDYLELSRQFDTIFIRHVPQLTVKETNQARRLITLIDILYDNKVRVVILAQVPLDRIFVHGQQSLEDEGHRMLMDDLGLAKDAWRRLSIFTAEEEIFSFRRTLSRLKEMQTAQYWAKGDRTSASLNGAGSPRDPLVRGGAGIAHHSQVYVKVHAKLENGDKTQKVGPYVVSPFAKRTSDGIFQPVLTGYGLDLPRADLLHFLFSLGIPGSYYSNRRWRTGRVGFTPHSWGNLQHHYFARATTGDMLSHRDLICTRTMNRHRAGQVNFRKPESTDTDIIPEEEDDEEDTASSMTINASGTLNNTSIAGEDQNSPNGIADINAASLGQDNAGSPLSSKSPATAGSGASSNGLGSQQPRKSSSRRNAWGNLSYADLITKAIESTPDKRLTLSQIYDWMVRCVPYFKDKGDSNSSAGWKNSIRHNLSLHSRFIRVQNEGTGKSSWWMINPDGGKGGKAPRRRAVSMDNSNKYTKSRGRAAKKKAALQAAQEGGSESPSGLSKWPGSPTSRSSDELDAWTDFRSRTNSNASTISGRLSPILANPELDEVPDDESPLSPMLYSSPNSLSPSGGKPCPAELPLADMAGTMNLNDGLSDNLMDDLLDNINLTPPQQPSPGGAGGAGAQTGSAVGGGAIQRSPGFTFSSKGGGLGSPSGSYSNSIFGPPSLTGLRQSPMQTIQENKQATFSCISHFGNQTLQDLLNSETHSHADVMMTQSDPLMSQASASVTSQNSRRNLMLRNDPMMSFTAAQSNQGSPAGHGSLLLHQAQSQSPLTGGRAGLSASINGALGLANETNNLVSVKHQLQSPGGNSAMQVGSSDSSLYSSLNGSGICLPPMSQDKFPSDLDLDMFNGSLECDMDSIIRSELMDADGLDFDSLISAQNVVNLNVGSFTNAKQNPHWVPG